MALAKLYEEDIQTNVSASNIIDISEFRKMHKAQKELLEEWLIEWMGELYGETGDTVVKNPLLRLFSKFEALSSNAQNDLYGYAKRVILGAGGELSLYEKFRSIIEMGGRTDHSWQRVEDYADVLLINEKVYR